MVSQLTLTEVTKLSNLSKMTLSSTDTRKFGAGKLCGMARYIGDTAFLSRTLRALFA